MKQHSLRLLLIIKYYAALWHNLYIRCDYY